MKLSFEDHTFDFKWDKSMYLPGGSWVVIDPSINPAQMEMFADNNARGGVLEAEGLVSIKLRMKEQRAIMERLDPEIKRLKSLPTGEVILFPLCLVFLDFKTRSIGVDVNSKAARPFLKCTLMSIVLIAKI